MVAVDNSGQLSAVANGTGLGLLNLQERLARHYQGRASFGLVQSAEEVVTATLVIPLTPRPCAS